MAHALGQPVAALCRPLFSERLGLSAFYHRKFSSAGVKSVRAIESQCLLDVVAIREMVSMVDLPATRVVPNIDLDDAKGDPSVVANMLRLAWQLPRGPLANLCETLERAGCLIVHQDFGIPEMDAMYQKVPGLPPLFWVNSRKPWDRVRFSLAHELGHLLLHDERPTDDRLAEEQANAFAAAFLMPAGDFRGECPSRLQIPALIELKRRWRCSMSAIIRRARDVKKVSEPEYTRAMMEMSRRGWRKQEPYPIVGESPVMMSWLVQRCMTTTDSTVDQLANRIAVPLSRVIEWQQPFPGQRPDVSQASPTLRLTAVESERGAAALISSSELQSPRQSSQ